ncbi:SLAP domain-containing protein [Brevibacillus sp. H7]|jgi:SLAP domain-containing protein|uniref:SLAP domain-containing protein n=1 Tax=Brevibacillus sp. H7 TaxID=3349138 RepID=UPI00381296AF
MSWLLENWFGSKESLEQVREDIQEHLHKETYLGVSGIENPEQSSNRLEAKELFLTLHGPWGTNLDEMESELLQYVHDELPPVVRDEVGIIPFFANPTMQGYLVLAFIRNATNRSVLINRLPLALVTPEGEVVARKTFDLMTFGPIGDMASRPCDFLFRWEEFLQVPEQEVPLTLIYEAPKQSPVIPEEYKQTDGLTADELAKYKQLVGENPEVVQGEVDLKVVDIVNAEHGGLKVVVLFRNGLSKRLEFTEVPIFVRTKQGEEVARVQYGLKNMKVEAESSRLWGFYIPADSLKKPGIEAAECIAHIPSAKREHKQVPVSIETKGLIQ